MGLLGCLIYLEILVIDKCGLGTNVKINIKDRASKTFLYDIELIKDSSINEDSLEKIEEQNKKIIIFSELKIKIKMKINFYFLTLILFQIIKSKDFSVHFTRFVFSGIIIVIKLGESHDTSIVHISMEINFSFF